MRVFHLLQKSHGTLFRAANQSLKQQYGLTVAHQAVLFLLAEQDGRSISELAAALAMGKSSLTSLIERMCAGGLVRKVASAEDGRSTQVFIEDRGQAMVERTKAQVKATNQKLLSPFTDEEQQVINRFLNHIINNSDDILNDTAQFDDKPEPR